MTAKEKAIELIGKFNFTHDKVNGEFLFHQNLNESKRCALIAVEEMLGEYQSMSDSESIIMINYEFKFVVHQLVYWMEVKHEIENFAKELKLKDIQL